MAKPKIRFNGYQDDWEQRKLKEIADKVSEKNKNNEFSEPFTNSAEQGIISQKDYFDREIVNNENLDGYYIVRNDDFIYNPRISVTAPVGPINRNRLGRNGVMSPLYTVFRTHDIDNLYLEFYFKTTKWHRFMKLNGDSGARFDRFTISSIQFMEMPIPYPTLEEQRKIGEYFDSLDNLITLHQRILVEFAEKSPSVWEQRKLGDVLERRIEQRQQSKEYPRLAFASGQGVIPLSERKTNNREQLTKDEYTKKYLVTELNDIVYNPANVKYGAIDRNKCGRGLISPIYVTFTTSEIPGFIERIVTSHDFQQRALRFEEGTVTKRQSVNPEDLVTLDILVASKREEQQKIATYFDSLDNLITLHHRKYENSHKICLNDWEQRKLGELGSLKNGMNFSKEAMGVGYPFVNLQNIFGNNVIAVSDLGKAMASDSQLKDYNLLNGDVLFVRSSVKLEGVGEAALVPQTLENTTYSGFIIRFRDEYGLDNNFKRFVFGIDSVRNQIMSQATNSANKNISQSVLENLELAIPSKSEQQKIGAYFSNLDNLITLHHRKLYYLIKIAHFDWKQRKLRKNADKLSEKNKNNKFLESFTFSSTQVMQMFILYPTLEEQRKIVLIIVKEKEKMPELEKIIEEKLIDQLIYGESQWTYRGDLKTEEDLWKNFKYILEQNNKDRLNGESLSDTEFEQVKNQLQFSSFYKAGEWLVGENGKVMVHIQRDTERLHLVVMNHEHIAGGSSVYEVINQYSALKTDDMGTTTRDRRFDVTLMINGLPMIHIELKNRQHSYMDAFWQIKKYISEGKFTGIFSAIQMFVVSNGVDTKYFAAAGDTELNPKFMSGWVDSENNPVSDYIDFAKSVLRIPEAHEMIARYTVLDEDAKRLILLRPYQIHAIESIREASKESKSGFVWHTTGSGKTLTSYKATRNLLMDIPAIDKAIFLIDRKDLDTQTTMAFQAYANNDLVDVDETDNVNDLKKKLKSDDRQVIVTTIQKMQILISKRLQEGTTDYSKIKNLKIAFVVDECHRAVTPKTKRELERFFGRSLWYGFTGTPRFAENPYPQMGDLPRTTEELYGKRLHKYTIQNAIHDNAVLGFQVEHNGPKNIEDETNASAYDNETHMLRVLDIILNKSFHKLGFQNGKGKTYEGLLTTSSIQIAQKYYELLTKVKNGETSLEIDEKIKQVLPDFPKFAITYSVTENEEGSHVNQEKMQNSLDDYNQMFGTKYELSQIQGYNGNLNKRLARKDSKFKSRSEQLDLVIVVDRLLTGFDAPCMSTIFIDRQPMGPHDLIQAFSRTNRIFDKNKTYGQIVTFQAPKLFKESVDNAVKLYSAGSTEEALVAEWEEVEPAFRKSLTALRIAAETPEEVKTMSIKEKKVFVKMFQTFDRLFAQLKSFTQYDDSMLEEYGITEEEYDKYAGGYKNAVEEIKIAEGGGDGSGEEPPEETIDVDYELMAYSSTKIDYEYIINLIQNIVTPNEDAEAVSPEERQKQIDEVKQYIEEMRKDNPKVAEIMTNLVSEIEEDENKYKGQSILNIVENMKRDCIEKVISDFCEIWYASKEDVMYAALHYRNGEIPNESVIKATIDYQSYKSVQEKALPKFKYYAQCMAELRKTLDKEIKPLLSVA